MDVHLHADPGHFSKFIHPGSVHLDSEVLRSGAVKGGTKKVVLVLVKSGKPPLAMCFFHDVLEMFWPDWVKRCVYRFKFEHSYPKIDSLI